MNTLVFPFSIRSWDAVHFRQGDEIETHPVRDLLNRVQAHVQRNLAFIIDKESAHELTAPRTLPQTDIQLMGRSSDVLDNVRECVLVKHRNRQVLSAVRTADHRLHLFSWRVNADGTILHTGATGPQAEHVTQVEITKAGKYVVACRTGKQQVQLSSWYVTNTGAIYRASEHQIQDEQITKVKLLALEDALFTTACRTRQRLLRLTTWRMAPDERFIRVDEAELTGAPRHAFAMLTLPAQGDGRLLATALCTAEGQLRLQLWRVSTEGLFAPAGREILHGVCGVQLHAVVDPHGHLVTAVRTVTGHLRMMTWEVGDAGGSVQLLYDTGELSGHIRHQALMYGPTGVLTALTMADRRLKLTAWRTDALGEFHRTAENDSLPANGPVSLCPDLLDGNAPILMGVPTPQRGMQLITWRT
jgi:hypothetical protein